MTTEMIPVIWPKNLKIAGAVQRKYAHEFGLPHLTVLLMAARTTDTKIATYVRSPQQSFPGSIDIFGGHCVKNSGTRRNSRRSRLALKSLIQETAIREANEELRPTNLDGTEIVFDLKNADYYFSQIGAIGEFAVAQPTNVERSTLFLVKIPETMSINPCDEIDGHTFQVEVQWRSLQDLLADYRQSRPFADGASRVLKRVMEDGQFRKVLEDNLHDIGTIGRK